MDFFFRKTFIKKTQQKKTEEEKKVKIRSPQKHLCPTVLCLPCLQIFVTASLIGQAFYNCYTDAVRCNGDLQSRPARREQLKCA
jgi:hypothetical protein